MKIIKYQPTRHAPHLIGRHHLQHRAPAPRRAPSVTGLGHGELGAPAAEMPDSLVAEGMGTWPGTPFLGGKIIIFLGKTPNWCITI